MTENYRNFLQDLLKVFGLILNAFIFFRIVTYTFIEVSWLLVGFVFVMSIRTIIYRHWKLPINLYQYYLIYLPFLFNLFFLVNYVFSSNDRNETYDYQYGLTDIQGDRGPRSSKKGRSTTIHLEDRKYEAYYFPRMFFNYETMKDKKTITYCLEDGLFGFMVMKDYVFSQSNNNEILHK